MLARIATLTLAVLALTPAAALATTDPDAPVCPPTFGTITARPGMTFTRTLACTDPQGDPITYTVTQGIGSGSITPTGGVLTWTVPADWAHMYIDLLVEASDPTGHKSDSFLDLWIPSDPTAWPPLDTPVTEQPPVTPVTPTPVTPAPPAVVDSTPAALTVKQLTGGKRVTAKLTADEAVLVSTSLTQHGHILSNDSVRLVAGKPGTLTIKPSRRAKRGKATLTLIARDAGGNATKITRTVTLRK